MKYKYIYPFSENSDGLARFNKNETKKRVCINEGQIFRIQGYRIGTTNRRDLCFTVEPNNVYHFRYSWGGEPFNNYTPPLESFYLVNVNDVQYNPLGLDAFDKAFDTTYTDMWLAVVEVDAAGAITITPIENKPKVDEVIEEGGTGGGCIIERTDPVPSSHGGVEAGEVLQGKTPCEVLEQILYPYQYPAFTSFYIEGQATALEVGQSVAGGTRTFNWSTSNSSNVAPSSISISDMNVSSVLADGLDNDGTEALDIGADKVLTAPGAYTWRIEGDNTKGGSFHRDYSVRWYYRVYWGANVNDSLTEADVKALSNSQLKSGFAGAYNFTNSGSSDYYYIVYPDSWGDYNDWKDTDTGFGVDGTNAGTVDVTNDFGVTITYRMVRTAYQQTSNLNSQLS